MILAIRDFCWLLWKAYFCGVISFEDLEGIMDKLNKELERSK